LQSGTGVPVLLTRIRKICAPWLSLNQNNAKKKKKSAVKNNSEAGLPVFGEAVPAINRS
jgi:hypothetical protein